MKNKVHIVVRLRDLESAAGSPPPSPQADYYQVDGADETSSSPLAPAIEVPSAASTLMAFMAEVMAVNNSTCALAELLTGFSYVVVLTDLASSCVAADMIAVIVIIIVQMGYDCWQDGQPQLTLIYTTIIPRCLPLATLIAIVLICKAYTKIWCGPVH